MKLFDFVIKFMPGKLKDVEAIGDYYFDLKKARTHNAKAIRIPGYYKPIPYHSKLKSGVLPPNEYCILIWSSSNSLSTAYEDHNLEYAQLGALLDLIEYDKFVEIDFLTGIDIVGKN